MEQALTQSPQAWGAALGQAAGFQALLAHQLALYTGNESSSLPVETVQRLAQSLALTLRLDRLTLAQCQALAGAGEQAWQALFARGQARLHRQLAEARAQWAALCRAPLPLTSRALQDTLQSIGGLWGRYDGRFFAQELPCDIDYPLMRPVPETLLGLDYLQAWLGRLQAELCLLGRFSAAESAAVLAQVDPDWQELLLNLTEPVALRALARVLLGLPPAPLALAPAQAQALALRFLPLPRPQARRALLQGAGALCRQLGIGPGPQQQLLLAQARALAPRLAAALEGGWGAELFLCRGGIR